MNAIKRADGTKTAAPLATSTPSTTSAKANAASSRRNTGTSKHASDKHTATTKSPSSTVNTTSTSTPLAPTASSGNTNNCNSKLVFGLNPRTNRCRHDEYAEHRLKVSKDQVDRDSDTQQQQQQQKPLEKQQSMSNQTKSIKQVAKSSSDNEDKYLKQSVKDRQSASHGSDSNDLKSSPKTTSRTRPKKSSQAGADVVVTKITDEGTNKPAEKGSLAATDNSRTTKQQQQRLSRPDKTKETVPAPAASIIRARSRSPDDRSARMARRNSFEEDLSTTKIEQPIGWSSKSQQLGDNKEEDGQQKQQQPILKARTQFNIRPPPQMSISSLGKGSVVGYAKARIYDKPAKQSLIKPPQPNPLDTLSFSPWSSLDDQNGLIPKSISSGFKPPKTVNVTKAREKWEGGEPFTKCKSRQRLAVQANKKLFPGTWSMTSVVATQQLHLKQALAQSSSSMRSNIHETDPSVKVLTRGSVLERVQQFERVPLSSSSSNGASSSSLSSSSLSGDTGGDRGGLSPSASTNNESDALFGSDYLSRSSSTVSSSTNYDSDSEAAVAISGHNATPNSSPSSAQLSSVVGVGKKAHYKQRVSSIQQQQQLQPFVSTVTDQSVAKSSSTSIVTQQRRLSLRRRSSILGGTAGQNNSTSSLIPKFYHPNGKPNTYEIELQKRNIVACFDNFPDRSAQIDGPNSKRHFHQIALACNFSEYFKVPLNLYVKYKMETCPQLFTSNLTKSPSGTLGTGSQRRTSTVSLSNTNGLAPATTNKQQQQQQPLKRHTRSNSVALNQLSKSLVKAASIDSSSLHPLDKNEQKELVSYVTCDQFLACWRDLISCSYDNVARFVHLLTFGQRNYLQPEDFVPLVQSVIDDHPGLKFLRAAPDFHMRYIQTVIARIYFCINKSWTGKITLQELRQSNLLAVLQVLSQEEDINQITDYFSYEHFYVIYCKFWNLDQDHDLLISKEDLARHNDAAISSRIIERIFSNVVSKQIQKTGKMNYSDFVWFIIAEEDKKHPRSIEYWFRLMDLDGDGYISMYEMEYFYYEQMKRLELMNIEPLPFLDSACQILDLVNPKEKNKISLADLKRTKMATIFFDTFINLEKYLEHESREFVSTRDIVQDGVVVSDWDRYASEEYENLVTEETSV